MQKRKEKQDKPNTHTHARTPPTITTENKQKLGINSKREQAPCIKIVSSPGYLERGRERGG